MTDKSKKTQKGMNTTSKANKSKSVWAAQRHAEAKARRKVAERWEILAHGLKYKKAAVFESCVRTTMQMEEELFDGILLNLNSRNSRKSYNIQKRILRRIVEKRQAKSVRRQIKRTEDRFTSHMLRSCASKSMRDLHNMFCGGY